MQGIAFMGKVWGGAVIPHSRIAYDILSLFRGDGVYLSMIGYDIFLSDPQQGLRKVLFLCRAVGPS